MSFFVGPLHPLIALFNACPKVNSSHLLSPSISSIEQLSLMRCACFWPKRKIPLAIVYYCVLVERPAYSTECPQFGTVCALPEGNQRMHVQNAWQWSCVKLWGLTQSGGGPAAPRCSAPHLALLNPGCASPARTDLDSASSSTAPDISVLHTHVSRYAAQCRSAVAVSASPHRQPSLFRFRPTRALWLIGRLGGCSASFL